MFRKSVEVAVFVVLLTNVSSALAAETDTSFQDEIKLSCKKYAVEDQIPLGEVKAYVDLCVRDFNKPQTMDESFFLGIEEGIGAIPIVDESGSSKRGEATRDRQTEDSSVVASPSRPL